MYSYGCRVCSCYSEAFLHHKGSSNGLRYPLVGGVRERHFAGTNLKPNKLLKNAQTPTSRVHAVLGAFSVLKPVFSTLVFGSNKLDPLSL